MINDLVIGDAFSMAFVVVTSELKYTKTNKPYVALTVSDGKTTIAGNIWDWYNATKPEKNTIINIDGSLGEYNGTRQLNIVKVTKNNELQLQDFLPKSPRKLDALVESYVNLMNDIKHPILHSVVQDIFSEYNETLTMAPGAKYIHHAYAHGLLEHLVGTAKIAAVIAAAVKDDIELNMDLVIAGALIHDIGKINTYITDGMSIEMTTTGCLAEHIIEGCKMLADITRGYRHNQSIMLLEHIIASHHGVQEHGAAVPPKCIEAYIVHIADLMDSRVNVLAAANDATPHQETMTKKLWAIDNTQFMTQRFVTNLIENYTTEEEDECQDLSCQ